MRPSSTSRDPTEFREGPNDFSPTRGREVDVNPTKVYSTGRGGAGNIRSPSRDPVDSQKQSSREREREREIIRNHDEQALDQPHSSGRGGFGNISGSRSRSRDAASKVSSGPVHSTGRGGAGNIVAGDIKGIDASDYADRKLHTHSEEPHSTGRGGLANVTAAQNPGVEHHVNVGANYSSGRGGVGNIRNSSASRERHGGLGGIGGLVDKIIHPGRA